MKICNSCKKEKPESDFRLRSDRPNTLTSKCKDCSVKYVTERRKQAKKEFIKYKGGCCQLCGYNKCDGALEFHHKDPSKKDFQINRGASLIFEKVKDELDKCALLCANCHREVHAGIAEVD